MKRIALWFYRRFPELFNQLVFEDRPPVDEFGKMKYAFTCGGLRYYRYSSDLDLPLDRKAQIDLLLLELESSIEGRKLSHWLDKMQAALGECMGGDQKALAKVGFLVEQMQQRQGMLFHDRILFALIAAQYIREDEKPWVWSQALQDQKIADLRKEYESEGALYDFFVKARVKDWIPFTSISGPELWQLWTKSKKLTQDQDEAIAKVMTTSF